MSHFLYDGPPTVAEMTGLTALAAQAAETVTGADRRDREAAQHQRARLIAQGRIKPASRADGLRAMLIAKGQILPADPAEVEKARRPRLARVTLAGGYDAMIAAGER